MKQTQLQKRPRKTNTFTNQPAPQPVVDLKHLAEVDSAVESILEDIDQLLAQLA